MRKLFAWIHSHPIIAVLDAFVAVCLAAHFFLNWRAERRWQAYAEAARARGVKLALTDFAPPEIPDAENFAALPMMRAIFQTGAISQMALPKKDRPDFGNPLKGERFDWEKWQTFFKDAGFISETTDSPPRDVLRALEHYAPQFQEWSEWKTRTRCRFDLDFKAGAAMLLPHLSIFSDAAKLFGLRMRAHLVLGDSSAAYADFRDGLQTYRALTEEPTLINGLVQISVLSNLVSAIRDGLADHTWSEPELLKIDADLATILIWKDYRRAFVSEQAGGIMEYDALAGMWPLDRAKRISAYWGGAFIQAAPPFKSWIGALVPTWLIRDNQLRMNQYEDELLASVSADGVVFDPAVPTSSDADHLTGMDAYYFFLVNMSAPLFAKVAEKFCSIGTQLEQARIAIALERFRKTRTAFPESLAKLVPEFMVELPLDIYTGQPMNYRRKDSGDFLLYSVGPNRRDDSGAIDPKKSDMNQLDWVWPHSPGN